VNAGDTDVLLISGRNPTLDDADGLRHRERADTNPEDVDSRGPAIAR
jgi:hypothetical protein